MKLSIGSDHAGFRLKKLLVDNFQDSYKIIDIGTHSEEPVDYPDIAREVCNLVVHKKTERGIILCGSGVGACIAANKITGIRASVCHDCYSARQGVEHDDMNILVLGAKIIGENLAYDLVTVFLNANFISKPRYIRRLDKIRNLEDKS